jgi:hypothetical protein
LYINLDIAAFNGSVETFNGATFNLTNATFSGRRFYDI